jgi:preprotein translocase subunit SecA
MEMIQEELRALVATYSAMETEDGSDWDAEGLYLAVRGIMPLPPEVNSKSWQKQGRAEIEQQLLELAEKLYDFKEHHLGAERMRQLERLAMLRVVDSLWVNHLTALDELREGIGLRAYGQRDPLVEYKREAHEMFATLTEAIKHDIVHSIYYVNLTAQPVRRAMRAIRPGESAEGAHTPHKAIKKVGRNDPCPCGSGKKYKNCCMKKEHGGAMPAAPASAPIGVSEKGSPSKSR